MDCGSLRTKETGLCEGNESVSSGVKTHIGPSTVVGGELQRVVSEEALPVGPFSFRGSNFGFVC